MDFAKQIYKIDNKMGYEFIKCILYSTLQHKYDLTIYLPYDLNLNKAYEGIDFLPKPTRRNNKMDLYEINEKFTNSNSHLHPIFIDRCIQFIIMYCADKDEQNTYKKYNIEKYDDEYIMKQVKYTSFNKSSMKKIYDFVKKHPKKLNDLYAYLKFNFNKQLGKINSIEFVSTSYNIKDIDTKYYKQYDKEVNMTINKTDAYLVKFTKTNDVQKWKKEVKDIISATRDLYSKYKFHIINLSEDIIDL